MKKLLSLACPQIVSHNKQIYFNLLYHLYHTFETTTEVDKDGLCIITALQTLLEKEMPTPQAKAIFFKKPTQDIIGILAKCIKGMIQATEEESVSVSQLARHTHLDEDSLPLNSARQTKVEAQQKFLNQVLTILQTNADELLIPPKNILWEFVQFFICQDQYSLVIPWLYMHQNSVMPMNLELYEDWMASMEVSVPEFAVIPDNSGILIKTFNFLDMVFKESNLRALCSLEYQPTIRAWHDYLLQHFSDEISQFKINMYHEAEAKKVFTDPHDFLVVLSSGEVECLKIFSIDYQVLNSLPLALQEDIKKYLRICNIRTINKSWQDLQVAATENFDQYSGRYMAAVAAYQESIQLMVFTPAQELAAFVSAELCDGVALYFGLYCDEKYQGYRLNEWLYLNITRRFAAQLNLGVFSSLPVFFRSNNGKLIKQLLEQPTANAWTPLPLELSKYEETYLQKFLALIKQIQSPLGICCTGGRQDAKQAHAKILAICASLGLIRCASIKALPHGRVNCSYQPCVDLCQTEEFSEVTAEPTDFLDLKCKKLHAQDPELEIKLGVNFVELLDAQLMRNLTLEEMPRLFVVLVKNRMETSLPTLLMLLHNAEPELSTFPQVDIKEMATLLTKYGLSDVQKLFHRKYACLFDDESTTTLNLTAKQCAFKNLFASYYQWLIALDVPPTLEGLARSIDKIILELKSNQLFKPFQDFFKNIFDLIKNCQEACQKGRLEHTFFVELHQGFLRTLKLDSKSFRSKKEQVQQAQIRRIVELSIRAPGTTKAKFREEAKASLIGLFDGFPIAKAWHLMSPEEFMRELQEPEASDIETLLGLTHPLLSSEPSSRSSTRPTSSNAYSTTTKFSFEVVFLHPCRTVFLIKNSSYDQRFCTLQTRLQILSQGEINAEKVSSFQLAYADAYSFYLDYVKETLLLALKKSHQKKQQECTGEVLLDFSFEEKALMQATDLKEVGHWYLDQFVALEIAGYKGQAMQHYLPPGLIPHNWIPSVNELTVQKTHCIGRNTVAPINSLCSALRMLGTATPVLVEYNVLAIGWQANKLEKARLAGAQVQYQRRTKKVTAMNKGSRQLDT
jgi:hypothetical protein